MKTALQELIEDLQDRFPDYYNNNYNWLHNLLDKEKKQIIDAYETAMETDIYNVPLKVGEQYYNETFKTK